MNFAQKITKIRKGLGLSQEEFGSMIHVSRQAVSKWELGQSKPDIDTLVLLCKTFQLSSDELLSEDHEKKEAKGHDESGINLKTMIQHKQRFLFGILLMAVGVVGIFFLWLDIRVGSYFYEPFWRHLIYHPVSLLLFLLFIFTIIYGLKFSYKIAFSDSKDGNPDQCIR